MWAVAHTNPHSAPPSLPSLGNVASNILQLITQKRPSVYSRDEGFAHSSQSSAGKKQMEVVFSPASGRQVCRSKGAPKSFSSSSQVSQLPVVDGRIQRSFNSYYLRPGSIFPYSLSRGSRFIFIIYGVDPQGLSGEVILQIYR